MTSSLASSGVTLGFAVSARVAYLGVVDADGSPITDGYAPRIQPADQLDLDSRLGDFRDRCRQELRALRPARAAVLKPRLYAGWTYKDAFDRFSLETAFILACIDEAVPSELTRSEDAAKAVNAPIKDIPAGAAAWWTIDVLPKYWKARAGAFAAAAAPSAR